MNTGVNFINILHTNFSYEYVVLAAFSTYVHVIREKLPKGRLYKKIVCLMLMKLTPGGPLYPRTSLSANSLFRYFKIGQKEAKFPVKICL